MVIRVAAAALALFAMSAFWIPGARAQDSNAAPDALVEKYGDWTVECGNAAGEPEPFCRMTQRLKQDGAQRHILSVFIRAKSGDSVALMTLIGPLGISLAKGITVSAGDKRLVEADFLTCIPRGCMARIELGSEAIEAFSAGDEAIVTMVALNGDPFSITVSLNGFTAAWARLNAP